ncbi:MAG: hypothetical protein JJU28_20955 [Cyclobacteriaceae bacterium]|nr:hypothetical protein [Cyclobacteriaceae bacterium]
MNKDYDKIFQEEIVRILNELYNNPINMGETKIKRAVIQTEKRFVTYLLNHNLVSNLKSVSGGGKWGLQLESNGYEVFEKYNGWDDYKKKVIDPKSKVEKAKELSVKYWWIPILISLLSLAVAIIALIKS